VWLASTGILELFDDVVEAVEAFKLCE
jgi:hypothetical protein